MRTKAQFQVSGTFTSGFGNTLWRLVHDIQLQIKNKLLCCNLHFKTSPWIKSKRFCSTGTLSRQRVKNGYLTGEGRRPEREREGEESKEGLTCDVQGHCPWPRYGTAHALAYLDKAQWRRWLSITRLRKQFFFFSRSWWVELLEGLKPVRWRFLKF